MSVIGVIGAMDEELKYLKKKLNPVRNVRFAGMDFSIAGSGGNDIVLVRSGIGKINAAICTQVLIDEFGAEMIINTGAAGAVDEGLEIGDIVISSDLVEHDFDTSGLGDPLGQIPRMDTFSFKADEKLVHVANDAGRKVIGDRHVVVGRIASGDQFVCSEQRIDFLRNTFGAAAVEMEGAAVGHACHLNGIPFVVIRSISDKADRSATVDFAAFIRDAAKFSAEMVLQMLSNLK